MNRNLHSPTKLTEFARDFDIEPDTFFAKFVNKITNVYNSGYNTVNVVPARQSFLQGPNSSGSSTPTNSLNESNFDGQDTDQLSDTRSIQSQQLSTSKDEEYDSVQGDDISPLQHRRVRNPSSVLQRISSLMAIRNNDNLSSYKNTELHQFWMPDNKSKECYECSQKFSTFRRKHHCRLCGQIFCSKCCNQVVPGKIIKCSGDLKVCTYCSKIVLTYLNSSDINSDLKSDLQALQDDLAKKFQFQSDDGGGSAQESSSPHRKISVGYQEERLLSQPKYLLSNADRKNILQQSTSLKVLYEDVAKALPNQNPGSDIIHYLITKNKASNKSQAIAILTAMIEAGYIIEIDLSGINPAMANTSSSSRQLAFYLDENDDGNTSSSENPNNENDILHEFNEHAYYKLLRTSEIMSNSGTFNLNLDVDNTSVHLSKPETGGAGVDGLPTNAHGLLTSAQARELDIEDTVMSTTGSKGLQEAFCKHEDLLLTQLLRNENLDESWSKTLIPICARIVNTLPPEMIGRNQMDIRNYVNFKKVPDGSRKDSCIVRGAVFSKNVIHKGMATMINDARILLLQCPIVYQRVEGKYVTIETLMLQESEYLTNVVGRIRAIGPNIILVHKNVSGIAQEMLRRYNITLVVDVKLSVLKRLSRCLQCDVVQSIDSNIGRPKLGVCEKFYIQTFSNSIGMCKTLMFFETPSNPRGCSVLLRGGDHSELVRVKRVAAFLLFARYNWRMEMSFLLNEFARPPSPKLGIFDTNDYSPSSEDGQPDQQSKAIVSGTTTTTQVNSEKGMNQNQQRAVKKTEKKSEEKLVTKENVQDFSDPLRATDPVPHTCDAESPVKFAVEQPHDNRFRTALNSTILSISPFSNFPLPYFETESGRKCALRKRFPDELYYSKQWSDNIEKLSHNHLSITKSSTDENTKLHTFLLHKIVEPSENKEFQSLLASFRASGGMLKKKITMETIERKQQQNTEQTNTTNAVQFKDALDINNHQSLPLLFTYFYYSTDGTFSFCVHPNILNVSFYGDNDIMLGQFLERYCFDNSYVCNACKLPVLGHIRRYVHSMGCVTVKLNEEDQKHKQITMCSWCSKCKETSKSVKMQKDTYCLSFGKYLELRFHGHAYRCRDLKRDETDLTTSRNVAKSSSSDAVCTHSLHRDHVQYFSFNGIVASFSYAPVEVWEISLPALKIELKIQKTNDAVTLYTDEIKLFASRGYEVFATIYDRLAQLLCDVEFPLLNSLKRTLNNDQLAFRERKVGYALSILNETSSVYEIDDAIFMMKKSLTDYIEAWTQRLADASVQYRAICAAATKSDSTSTITTTVKMATPTAATTASAATVTVSAVAATSPSVSASTGSERDLQESQSIDSGTICTEDFRSEPESLVDQSRSNVFVSRDVSIDSENSIQPKQSVPSTDGGPSGAVPTNQATERDTKTSTSSDKKSVKTILRDLLPSEKSVQPLPSPIPAGENLSLPIGFVPVIVHDQDFSSVIAYSLSSNDYKRKLDSLNCLDIQRKTIDSCGTDTEDATAAITSSSSSSSTSNTTTNTATKESDKEKKSKASHSHIEMNFQDSMTGTQFTCKAYFARDFDMMRCKLLTLAESIDENEKHPIYRKHANSESESKSGRDFDRKSSINSLNLTDEKYDDGQRKEFDKVRAAFIRSLSKSVRWEARGGKSGSKFCKTMDDRFVLKEMTKHDVSKFEYFGPNYFDYINQCLQNDRTTLLAKIFGVFKVSIKKKDNVQEKSLLIMENLFYDYNIDSKFDLKGSVRNRLVDPNNQNGEETVLLDENLIQMSWSDPLYILTHSKCVLNDAIDRDAKFLEKNEVMDYSLLVGCASGKLLVLGIIDYIRTYTFDKRIESIVKTNLMGKQEKPTIVPPKTYRQRFIKAMNQYFLAVPDRWEGLKMEL